MLGSVREIVKIKKIEILGAKAKSPRKTFSLWTTSNRLLPKLASRSENHHIIIKNAFFRICTETWPQSLQLFFSFFCVTKINLTIAIKRLLKNLLQNIQKSGFRQYLVIPPLRACICWEIFKLACRGLKLCVQVPHPWIYKWARDFKLLSKTSGFRADLRFSIVYLIKNHRFDHFGVKFQT